MKDKTGVTDEMNWDEGKCDKEIYDNGCQVLIIGDSNKIVSEFVKDTSHKLGCKLDFHNAMGRGIVKTLPNNYDKVMAYLLTLTEEDFEKHGITQYLL